MCVSVSYIGRYLKNVVLHYLQLVRFERWQKKKKIDSNSKCSLTHSFKIDRTILSFYGGRPLSKNIERNREINLMHKLTGCWHIQGYVFFFFLFLNIFFRFRYCDQMNVLCKTNRICSLDGRGRFPSYFFTHSEFELIKSSRQQLEGEN